MSKSVRSLHVMRRPRPSPVPMHSRSRASARWRITRTLPALKARSVSHLVRFPLFGVEGQHGDRPFAFGKPLAGIPARRSGASVPAGSGASKTWSMSLQVSSSRLGAAARAAGSDDQAAGAERERREPLGSRTRRRARARASAAAPPARGRPPARRRAGGAGRTAAPAARGAGRAPLRRRRVGAAAGDPAGQLAVGAEPGVTASCTRQTSTLALQGMCHGGPLVTLPAEEDRR